MRAGRSMLTDRVVDDGMRGMKMSEELEGGVCEEVGPRLRRHGRQLRTMDYRLHDYATR